MRILLAFVMVLILSAAAEAQNRRDRTSSRDRGPDRSSGSASPSPVDDSNTDKESFDRYKVLSEHNIFTKNRRPTSRPTRDSNFDRPRPKAEVAFVLTGCVIEDDNRYAAFVENAQTGVTMKVSPGDAVASGKVTSIGFDYLEYEANGQKVKVEIGHNFTGSVASLAEVIAAPSTATTGPTTGPVDLSNLSIEERLRRRRLQETGGK